MARQVTLVSYYSSATAMARLVIALAALALLTLGTVHGRVGVGSGEQEWGYATVRPGAHMFWWLYFTTNKDVKSFYDKPLVIWLQGGPGASSTGYGNFEELGPYDVDLNPRNHTWVKNYNVLFIDCPVGAGFSYSDTTKELTRTNYQIAKDTVELMRQFYKTLPLFRKVPVYITSESYGGKMAAEIALEWYKAEKSGSIESNLKGVGLGDSWISPIDSVLTWAPFLLQTGLVDTKGYERIHSMAMETKKAVDSEQWALATGLWGQTEGAIMTETGGIDFYNIMSKQKYYGSKKDANIDDGEKSVFAEHSLENLMNNVVKSKLKLRSTWGKQQGIVFSVLRADFMKPATKIVERLLEETDLKVFVYTGQLDLIVDTPGTLDWSERLKWKDSENWLSSRRYPVVCDNIIEGYKKSYGNFAFYWVNRAGHMVPADNPPAMASILKDLTGH